MNIFTKFTWKFKYRITKVIHNSELYRPWARVQDKVNHKKNIEPKEKKNTRSKQYMHFKITYACDILESLKYAD